MQGRRAQNNDVDATSSLSLPVFGLTSPSSGPLRLLHLVAPGRDGGSRLLLRVCVAERAVAAVFGSGTQRLGAALAAEAAEEDARLGGEGESDGGVAAPAASASAAAAAASSVFRS